jgi:hypothetical protein
MGGKILFFCCDSIVLDQFLPARDRTAQICSVTQILLDPYFRTVEGLAVLIEKDWCAFGHKFQGELLISIVICLKLYFFPGQNVQGAEWIILCKQTKDHRFLFSFWMFCFS